MTHTASRSLFVTLATAAASLTTTLAAAQPAPAPDSLNAQERDALAAAEQLATDTSHALEQWLATQAITQDRLFARLYFPRPQTDPIKYTTPYDSLADRDLISLEDRALGKAIAFQYAIVTDINAYVPAHNTRFAQPLTGNTAQDYFNNRTKRMLSDPASLQAARSEARYLLQRTRLENGDVIYDVSVPINVRGKHWGCARIGFRRAE